MMFFKQLDNSFAVSANGRHVSGSVIAGEVAQVVSKVPVFSTGDQLRVFQLGPEIGNDQVCLHSLSKLPLAFPSLS